METQHVTTDFGKYLSTIWIYLGMKILAVLRPHQWLKNLLLLVPLFTSQTVLDYQILKTAVLGFLGFSLICSANYICNDLMDFEVDKRYQFKLGKPITSGKLSRGTARIEAAFLFIVGMSICLYLSSSFAWITLAYLTLGLVYSRFLKKIQQVNIIILVLFYEIRIFAGGALLSISISFWLIIFSYTIFSSLALLKKYSKKQIEKQENGIFEVSRQFDKDETFFSLFGIGFAALSLLTFSLYLNSDQVSRLYQHPELLWILIPFLQFLLFRMWRAAIDGKMHYDPILFILKDLASAACLTIILITILIIGRLNNNV